MSRNLILRSLALILAAAPIFAARLAAQDAPSVAEAARRTRQQKQAAAKPVKVVDDDTLAPRRAAPATPPADAVPDSAAAPAENTSAPPDAKKPAADADDEAKKKAEIEALKQEIADKKHSANLLQREISLAQDTYYSNPDHEHDKAGKEKLDSMQADLQQQQADLADLQAKLAALGGSEDSKPAAPPQP